MKQNVIFFSCVVHLTLLHTICGTEDTCKKDESGGQSKDCFNVEANLGADDIAEEVKVELLQRDLHMTQKKAKIETSGDYCDEVDIPPFNCDTQVSYQITTPPGNTKTLITQWYVNGTYGPVITLLPSMTYTKQDDAFRSMNACGVNPLDLRLYCALEINSKGSFLVRVSENGFGFVTKLLGWRFAGAFDQSDNFYVYGEHSVHPPLGKMSVIKGVSKMKAYKSWCGLPKVDALGGVEVDGQQNYRLGADFAFINYTIDKKLGGEQHYMASLIGHEMKLLRTYPDGYKMFTLTGTNLPTSMGPNGKPRVWGTAWAYRDSNRIYFSADDGTGLFGVNASNIDLGQKTAFLNKVGEAEPTDWNDGISCGKEYSPDIDECTHKMYRSTTEHFYKSNAESWIKVLNPKTGEVSTQGGWKVDVKDLKGMNACAINTKDNKIYCCLLLGNGQWIARLDSKGTVGFLKKVKGIAFAGVFDRDGRYWFFLSGTGGGLQMVEDLHKYTAYKTYENTQAYTGNTLQQDQDTTLQNGPSSTSFVNTMGADFNILVTNTKTYLVSILETKREPNVDFVNRISFVDITGGVAKKAIILTDASTPPLPSPVDPEDTPPYQDKDTQTWGSSWNLRLDGKEYLLFAADSGQGMYKMLPETIDWDAGTVKFESYAKADPISWNNGFSCRSEDPEDVVLGKAPQR